VSLEQFKTQVLLLHSQQSTLDTLSAGFNDRYSVHCATSGSEALSTLGETPIHVIVSAQDLPGMSGLEALREAKKRSPETIGILLAGNDTDDGLEALVGDQAVFQIVRGKVESAALIELIESAHKRARLLALAESANDTSANVDEPVSEHIVMETSANGSTIISDGTGRFPSLRPEKIQIAPGAGGRDVDVLVLTKDEEFLGTIKDSARGLHNVHHAVTNAQADSFVGKHKIGVLVTDAAMADDSIEQLTARLRKECPRLVAIVAGRRDDGEMLMDLINRGHVYRFLLKPVSPGRARLAIEASVKHHMEAPSEAFKPKTGASLFPRKDGRAEAKARAEAEAKRKAEEKAKAEAEAKRKAEEKAKAEAEARRLAEEKAKAEAEAKRKAEEQARAEEEAKRKSEEKAKAEAEARRKAEEEARRKAEEEARLRAEEEARRKAEEEARRKAEEEARRKAEEEARRKAEEEARAKAEAAAKAREEAEARARAKAEAKEKAKAEALARKQEKAEAKARAKAEAEARAKEKAEAKARAKAEAAERAKAEADARAVAKAEAMAREAARKIEPTISDEPFDSSFDDGLDDSFGNTGSFTDTMTDIAAAVGQSFSGAAGSVSGSAHDILDSFGQSASPLKSPKVLAIGGGAVAAIVLVGWFVMSGDSTPETVADDQDIAPSIVDPVVRTEPPVRSAPPAQRPAAETAASFSPETPYAALLEEARAARNAGDLLTPAGDSAVELYAAIAADAAGDPAFDAEFEAVIDQVLAVAEAAILASDADEADTALDMAAFADPDNARLTFLRVQVNELLLRDRAELARVAIRDQRYEDASRLISEARSFAGSDLTQVNLLSEELVAARSQQQVGATIETAKARLDSGKLVSPANDNARYYFELALSNDPQNQAAQQGLITIASKLVLQARDAIDAGRLNEADRLLNDARALDPSSSELSASAAALASAKNTVAEAERQAELKRQAEIERQAELKQQQDAELKAAAEQRERERRADEQRQAAAAEEARRQAEIQANQAATASPLGVGAAAPKTAQASTKSPAPGNSSSAPSQRAPAAAAAPEPEPDPPIARQQRTVVAATTQPVVRNEPPPTAVQTQSASAVNVQSANASSGSVSPPGEPEMVPISRLTRINYVGPEYPRSARRRNMQGSVEVVFTVTTDGRVRGLSVVRSEPGETFDQAAMDAVEQWRFEPVIENGVAVEKRSAVRLAFSLQ
jgi:TonB family protein